MRHRCVQFCRIYFGLRPDPGLFPEVQAEMEPLAKKEVRRCNNIKSRKNPDVQCKFAATHGDYCAIHHKNPRPFGGKAVKEEPTFTEQGAVAKIQVAWRRAMPLLRFRAQGPAANARDLATNETELYSLDTLDSIPQLYLFSFADTQRYIWVFDIRTLSQTMAKGFHQQNPYNREPLSDLANQRLHARITWLRARKYNILHANTDQLTPEQLWNQRVLDCFLTMESLGYYVSSEWFHEMNTHEHTYFYLKLYSLWTWTLGLSAAQKEAVVPGHLTPEQRLFRFTGEQSLGRSKAWWSRVNIEIIESFIGRAADREQQKLGVLYVLMALVHASRPAARALPWVVEAVADVP